MTFRWQSSPSSELPNYDLIVPALLKGGIEGLAENCKLTPGELAVLVEASTS
jgi:hypothetical protein